MATAQKPIDDDSFKFKLNGSDFFCYFLLSGNEDAPAPDAFSGQTVEEGILLTKSSIVSLDIHENFFAPEIVGSITINNPYNYIEDELITNIDTGENFLHIEFLDYETYKNGENRQENSLKYSFVLQDESNSVSKTDRSNNFKTYTLIDKNFHRLNRESEPGARYPSSNKSDVPIGDIIKDDIFKKVFGSENVVDEEFFTPGSHLINGNDGAFPNNIEHITPGLHWRYSDALKYLLRFNYSISQSQTLPVQPFLQYNRDTEKYTYLPLDHYFINNESLTIEAMGVGDLQGEDTGTENSNNPVSRGKDDENPVPFNTYQGMLHNTNLTSPFTTYTNEYFHDYIVKSSNNMLGSEESEVIELVDVIDNWKPLFVDRFRCVGGPPEPYIPFYKDKNRPIKPFSLPNYKFNDCKNLVTAQMVSNLTFFNLQLTLDIPGDTFRRPGKFLDVFKPGQRQVNGREPVSDAKLLGKWFITSVHHRFFKDKYQNVIICIKPYVGPEKHIDASLDPGILNRQLNKGRGGGLTLPGQNYGVGFA
jgi:hypothetical protein